MRRRSCVLLNRLAFCGLLIAIGVSSVACKRSESLKAGQTDESSGELQSTVAMNDPNAARQLVAGFHDIEQNSWRWTKGRFAVALRPPEGAAQKGAVLTFKFAVPDPVINKLNAVSLSARVAGVPLSPETYTKSGEFVYSREVEGRLLVGESVNVEFSLDKSIPEGTFDGRELGVIAASVGLEPR